jgi:pyridoxine 5-phosphate synthase
MEQRTFTKLSANVNAIAQLRNRRDLPWPSVVGLSRIALEAGAWGITVHPRPDERHVRRSDVQPLADLVKEFPHAEFNIEGYPDERLMEIVFEVRPHQVTLVPDDPSQATSDHGWDFRSQHNFLKPIVSRLKDGDMRVSLFADADADTIAMAADTGADRAELYTGPYGATYDDADAAGRELDKLERAAIIAREAGLGLNAGHDLIVANLPPLLAHAPWIEEVSIGHGLTAEALEFGMADAVKRFRAACGEDVTD